MMEFHTTMGRREFVKQTALGALVFTAIGGRATHGFESRTRRLRLGGPIFEKVESPEEWTAALQRLGYSAAYCPVNAKAGDDGVNAYVQAARKAGIVIAEVGAWSNPLDPNEEKRKTALAYNKEQLALADRINARCCVNISGARGNSWAGPHPKNLTDETFGLIVEIARSIIDDVKPKRTFYTLEIMPWAYPDSADSYLQLIQAIDRKAFAVHLDPANLICSPQRFYNNAAVIRECFEKLGPHIRSCHGKDIVLQEKEGGKEIFTVHLDEVRPGLGGLDYRAFLKGLSQLPDTPLMLEHLPTAQEYEAAAKYVRSVATDMGLNFI